MAIGDIFQLRLNWRLPNLEIANNVFWYEQTVGAGGNVTSLANGFVSALLPDLQAVMPSNVVLESYMILNTHNFTDGNVFVPGSTIAGSRTGMIDVTQALAYRKRPTGLGTHYSYKRFPAPGNISTTTRQWTDEGGTLHAALTNTGIALGDVIVSGAQSFTPIQVRGGWTMTETENNPTYFGEGNVIKNADLTGSWQFDAYPSHQVTRNESLWLLEF